MSLRRRPLFRYPRRALYPAILRVSRMTRREGLYPLLYSSNKLPIPNSVHHCICPGQRSHPPIPGPRSDPTQALIRHICTPLPTFLTVRRLPGLCFTKPQHRECRPGSATPVRASGTLELIVPPDHRNYAARDSAMAADGLILLATRCRSIPFPERDHRQFSRRTSQQDPGDASGERRNIFVQEERGAVDPSFAVLNDNGKGFPAVEIRFAWSCLLQNPPKTEYVGKLVKFSISVLLPW